MLGQMYGRRPAPHRTAPVPYVQIILEVVARNHRSGHTSGRIIYRLGGAMLTLLPRLSPPLGFASPGFFSARPGLAPTCRSPQRAAVNDRPAKSRRIAQQALALGRVTSVGRQRVNAVRYAQNSRMNAQTPASVFNGPEHWRQRAEEARRMAELMSDIPSKEAMLRVAEDYERLAKRAEERAKGRGGVLSTPRGERCELLRGKLANNRRNAR
jgi:hypothetical protein